MFVYYTNIKGGGDGDPGILMVMKRSVVQQATAS